MDRRWLTQRRVDCSEILFPQSLVIAHVVRPARLAQNNKGNKPAEADSEDILEQCLTAEVHKINIIISRMFAIFLTTSLVKLHNNDTDFAKLVRFFFSNISEKRFLNR